MEEVLALKIEGVFPPIPTPFDADGNILHDKLKSVRWSLPGLKVALDMLDDFCGGAPRLPLHPLGEDQRKELKGIMQAAGVL